MFVFSYRDYVLIYSGFLDMKSPILTEKTILENLFGVHVVKILLFVVK